MVGSPCSLFYISDYAMDETNRKCIRQSESKPTPFPLPLKALFEILYPFCALSQ